MASTRTVHSFRFGLFLTPLFGWILASVLVVALAGCSGGPSVVGKWKLDPASLPKTDNAMAGSLTAGLSKAISLELKADKTFEMNMILPFSGTYTVEGKVVKFTTTKAMGIEMTNNRTQQASGQYVGTLSDDGSKLSISSGSTYQAGSQPMVLIRDTTAPAS